MELGFLEDPMFLRIVSRSIVHLSQESTQAFAFADTSFGAVVCEGVGTSL